MEDTLLVAFRDQIERQCFYILRASITLQEVLLLNIEPWYDLQILLGATANLQKAFWGERENFATQREPLRQMLAVEDDSPLRANNRMRNHFEHFDERLDRWWRDAPHHNRVEVVGPDARTFLDESTVSDLEIFHGYDPATGLVTFWGDQFDLPAVVKEAERIWRICRQHRQREVELGREIREQSEDGEDGPATVA